MLSSTRSSKRSHVLAQKHHHDAYIDDISCSIGTGDQEQCCVADSWQALGTPGCLCSAECAGKSKGCAALLRAMAESRPCLWFGGMTAAQLYFRPAASAEQTGEATCAVVAGVLHLVLQLLLCLAA